nr:hypothetical protein [Kofleriaceae bacterium]
KGVIYVNNTHYETDDEAIAHIQLEAARSSKPKAIITGDRHAEYDGVMLMSVIAPPPSSSSSP